MNKWISNLKLSKKLVLSPALVLSLMIIISIISFRSLNNQQLSFDDIYNTHFKNTLAADRSFQAITNVQGNIYKFISWARAEYSQDKLNELSRSQISTLDKTIEDIKNVIKNDTDGEFSEFNKRSLVEATEYRQSVANVIDLASFDLNASTMAMGTVEDKFNTIEKTLSELKTSNIHDIDSQYKDEATDYHNVIKIFLVIIIFSIIFSILATGKINYSITKPIIELDKAALQVSSGNLSVAIDINTKDEIGTLASSFTKMITNVKDANELLKLEKKGVEEKVIIAIREVNNQKEYLNSSVNKILVVMKDFADGDLSAHLQVDTDDEIGKLFNGFNTAVANIRNTMKRVVANIDSTASASHQISSSSEEMAAGASEQSSQTAEVASSIEEMTKTIIDTTRNATEASEAAKQAGNIAKEGGEIVKKTIEGMNKIADVVKNSAITVETLGHSSDQIGEIIQVINDIADQTNLLALNAAIEAARAGEQGRGFAVVADEVRKLAERTTKATKEIASMIQTIQKDTKEAVKSMKQGTQEVEKGKELAGQAGVSLNEIINGSQRVVDMATQVAAASEEQSATAELISKSIDGINNITQESATGVQQIAKASEDLSKLTINLQQLTSQFKLDKNELFETNKLELVNN